IADTQAPGFQPRNQRTTMDNNVGEPPPNPAKTQAWTIQHKAPRAPMGNTQSGSPRASAGTPPRSGLAARPPSPTCQSTACLTTSTTPHNASYNSTHLCSDESPCMTAVDVRMLRTGEHGAEGPAMEVSWAERVKTLRRHLGLNQQSFGALLGLSVM